MSRSGPSMLRELARRGLTRRGFVEFCSGIAAYLSLPASAGAQIAAAVAKQKKATVVWLEYQDCAGCTESFLRAEHPTVAEVVLDAISVDYHETIMAAAGARAEEALEQAIGSGPYIAVVEGSIPSAEGTCTIGGRSALEISRHVLGKAAAVIAVGTCASFGGLPAASPNPTGAMSVDEAVPGIRTLVNLPGCPVNGENIVALIAHYLTFGKFPALDRLKRPLFAYGKRIHDNCERRAHFDSGQFVEAWGDEAHRSGYCLYKMGCKGPAAFNNCPNIGWNGGSSWPIACGHPCIGCSEPEFWDTMTPFYRHLTGFGGGIDVDKVGLIAAGLVGAGLAGHGLVRLGARVANRVKPAAPEAAPAPAPAAPADEHKGGAS